MQKVFEKTIYPNPNASATSSSSQPVDEKKAMPAAPASHDLPTTATVSHAPTSSSNTEQAKTPLAAVAPGTATILASSMIDVTRSGVAAPSTSLADPAVSSASTSVLERK